MTRVRPAAWTLLLSVALTATATGCDDMSQETSTGGGSLPGSATLTVLAASSLTESFSDLATEFEGRHRGVDVRLAFDSSATLASQVIGGAPADVLATADEPTMRSVTDAGAAASRPQPFAMNTMVLAIPSTNDADVRSFADLDRSSVAFVACVQSAPCGALASALLRRNDVEAPPKSLEVDAKAVLTKVILDEADAGLVYATDARAARDSVSTVRIPFAAQERTRYLAVPVEATTQLELANAWVRMLTSTAGQRILAGYGFQAP